LPILAKIEKPHEFKLNPIRKAETDFLMYKEIFINPKEKVLNELKDKSKIL
jgi:hypothetical protein